MRYSSVSHTHTCTVSFFFIPISIFFVSFIGYMKMKGEWTKYKIFFLQCIVMRLCVGFVFIVFQIWLHVYSIVRCFFFFNISKRCLRCSIVIVFFHCGNETMKKKLSVDNMRPPAATSFVIFLSSNSHFRHAVAVVVTFFSVYRPILSLLKLIIEFYKRKEQKEAVNAAKKKRKKNGAKKYLFTCC